MTERKYWPIGTAKMWSLGHFDVPPPKPTQRDYYYSDRSHYFVWEATFEDWVRKRLKTFETLHVRSPEHHWSVQYSGPGSGGQNWHCDGIGSRYLGCWSNTFGTEVRVRKGAGMRISPFRDDDDTATVYQSEPNEFVVFNNLYFEHRPPRGLTAAEKKKRWFVRLSAIGPMMNHPDVKECVL